MRWKDYVVGAVGQRKNVTAEAGESDAVRIDGPTSAIAAEGNDGRRGGETNESGDGTVGLPVNIGNCDAVSVGASESIYSEGPGGRAGDCTGVLEPLIVEWFSAGGGNRVGDRNADRNLLKMERGLV